MKKALSAIFLFSLLISLAVVIMQYRGLGYSDTNEFTPLFYRMTDPSYLKNDWFINATDNFNVRLYFVSILFFLSKIIPNIPVLYFILYAATLALAGISVYLASNSIFKNQKIDAPPRLKGRGLISARFLDAQSVPHTKVCGFQTLRHEKVSLLNVFLVLTGATFSLGGTLMFTNGLSSFLVSITLSTLGFYFLINKKLNYFSVMLGLASIVHFVSGHIVFALLFASSFISQQKSRKMIIVHVTALLIFSLFSLTTVPNLLADKESGMGFNAEQLREIVGEIRAPHHYLPFKWSTASYIEFGLFLALFLVSLKRANIDNDKKRLVSTITALLLLAILTSIFFVEIIPVKLFIKLNLFRLTTFFALIEYLFIGNFVFLKMKKEFDNKNLKFFIYPLLIFSLLSNHLVLISIPAFLLYLKFENKISISPKAALAMLAGGIFIIIALLFNTEFLSVLKAKTSTILFLVFSLMILLPTLSIILFNHRRINTLAFCSVFASIVIFGFVNHPILYEEPGSQISNAYAFIKANTDKEAIFITPPGLSSFRLGANRAIVADFKAFPFGEREMLEWKERMLDLAEISNFSSILPPEKQIIAGYKNLSDKQVAYLEEKYNASYAFFIKPKELNLKVAYQNDEIVIYDLRDTL